MVILVALVDVLMLLRKINALMSIDTKQYKLGELKSHYLHDGTTFTF